MFLLCKYTTNKNKKQEIHENIFTNLLLNLRFYFIIRCFCIIENPIKTLPTTTIWTIFEHGTTNSGNKGTHLPKYFELLVVTPEAFVQYDPLAFGRQYFKRPIPTATLLRHCCLLTCEPTFFCTTTLGEILMLLTNRPTFSNPHLLN